MSEQTIPEEVKASLRCRACNTFLRPPIRMCKCGRNVCHLCKVALGSICPVCQDTIGDHTNIELENMVRYFKAPMSCRFNAAGCTERMDLNDIIIHEEDCPFRNMKCLLPDCQVEFSLNDLDNHMSETHPDMEEGLWVVKKVNTNTTPAGNMVEGVSVVRGKDWKVINKDVDLNEVGTIIRAIPGYPGWVEVQWKSGKRYNHRMGQGGVYEVQPASTRYFASRTWHHSDVRFFATLFFGLDDFWHVMVSAACGRKKAAKFRAEIRLAPQNVPECSNVYHRPVESMETKVDMSPLTSYTACLDVHKKVVEKQTRGTVTNLQLDPEQIPFTCKAYEKVFVMFDKEDIEDKYVDC